MKYSKTHNRAHNFNDNAWLRQCLLRLMRNWLVLFRKVVTIKFEKVHTFWEKIIYVLYYHYTAGEKPQTCIPKMPNMQLHLWQLDWIRKVHWMKERKQHELKIIWKLFLSSQDAIQQKQSKRRWKVLCRTKTNRKH